MNSQTAITLLKNLEQCLDSYCELNDEGKTAFSMAITALELFGISEQLPSAQLQWIPVSERLPKQQQTVLIQDFGEITIGYLNAENRWRDLTNLDDYLKGVVAWMPLPEPYKEEQHD